jgi:hypothetical protein
MKRNRNSFFTNYNAQQQTFIPDGIPMPNQQIPYTQSSMNSNYYSGPALTNSNDIDNRLSKIERPLHKGLLWKRCRYYKQKRRFILRKNHRLF